MSPRDRGRPGLGCQFPVSDILLDRARSVVEIAVYCTIQHKLALPLAEPEILKVECRNAHRVNLTASLSMDTR